MLYPEWMSSGVEVAASHIFKESVANGNYIYQLCTLTIIGIKMALLVGFRHTVFCSCLKPASCGLLN